MRTALDTNRLTDALKGEPLTSDVVRRSTALFLPFPVVGEIRAGFRYGSQTAKNERQLRGFIFMTSTRILHSDADVIERYVDLYQQLRIRGQMIPMNDLWIAAVVLRHDLHLRRRDRHFDLLPQLKRV